MKRIVLRKPPGQALLIVLIVGTLTLLILLGVASRINLGLTNVRKSSEFDRSIAGTENKILDIVASFNEGKAQDCIQKVDVNPTNEYINLRTINNDGTCTFLTSDPTVDIFARLSNDPSVNVQFAKPVSLFLGLNPATPVITREVALDCQTDNTDRFVVTRVYVDSAAGGEYKVDKGIFTCNQASAAVRFFDANATDVTSAVRSDTKLIRVRMLDGSTGNNSVSIQAKDNNNAVVGTTQKYEFMIVGAGGLGSDSIIKFEKPRDPETPLAFDFVYFGEDI